MYDVEKDEIPFKDKKFLFHASTGKTVTGMYSRFHEEAEIKFVSSGRLTVMIDTKTIVAEEGEIIFINPYEVHSNLYVDGSDGIYDLIIRTLVVNKGNKQVQKLHLETSALVQASTQSKMMRSLQELLTEEEHAVYKRGRNAKSVSPAKNQSVTDYRRATGFEALLGYLYLKKEWQRILDLVKIGLDSLSD